MAKGCSLSRRHQAPTLAQGMWEDKRSLLHAPLPPHPATPNLLTHTGGWAWTLATPLHQQTSAAFRLVSLLLPVRARCLEHQPGPSAGLCLQEDGRKMSVRTRGPVSGGGSAPCYVIHTQMHVKAAEDLWGFRLGLQKLSKCL